MLRLQSQYEKQIIEAIGNFRLKYDEILYKGEIEKKVLILKVADILRKNFEEIGTFELVKQDISSIIMNIFANNNIISIHPSYINLVLTPLGYTNIRGKYKNKEQIIDENRAVKELNSAVIYTHNVVKDLSVYNETIKSNLSQLEKEEYKHFNDDEILNIKDSIMKVYEKVNQSINSRSSMVSIEQQIEQVTKTIHEEPTSTETNEEEDTEKDTIQKEKYKQKEQEQEIKQAKKEEQEGKKILNKIDKPIAIPQFENQIPGHILELAEQHKLMSKNLKKYSQVLNMYPEYDKEYHDKYCEAIKARVEYMKGENELIKPSTNLKFRRDPIGWIEIMELAEDMTEGAARSRSRVPATYLDDKGNLKRDFRKMSKEHITENLPYAKKMKQLLNVSNSYWMAINEYYIRNIQEWTNGFSVKNHDKSSNSA